MKNPTVQAVKARPRLARRTLVSSMVLAAMLGSACSTTGGGKDPFADYNSAFERGDYTAAASALETRDSDSNEGGGEERDVLRLLYRAEAQRLSGDYRGAIESYERAEAGLKAVDTEGTGEKALEGAGALAGVKGDYEPYEAEKVLINTYMALSYLSLGEDDNAGLQFRRAENRTDRAIDFFEQERAAAASRKVEIAGQVVDVDMLAKGSSSMDASVDTFEGYDSFMVPAASYLYGVYNMGLRDSSDAGKASMAFRRVAESHPDVDLFETEQREAERGQGASEPTVWVIYENGQAPSLTDKKLVDDVTVDVENLGFAYREEGVDPTEWKNSMQQSGLNPYVLAYAIPTTQPAVDAGSVSVKDSAGNVMPLSGFSSMDKVRQSEFDKREPAMKRLAFTSAAVKVAAQAIAANKAEKQGAGLGGFAARITGNASAATTSADTRSWGSLPGSWEVARFARPTDGVITLDDMTVDLPSWQRTLVYVKRPAAGAPLRASVIDLDGQDQAIEIGL